MLEDSQKRVEMVRERYHISEKFIQETRVVETGYEKGSYGRGKPLY